MMMSSFQTVSPAPDSLISVLPDTVLPNHVLPDTGLTRVIPDTSATDTGMPAPKTAPVNVSVKTDSTPVVAGGVKTEIKKAKDTLAVPGETLSANDTLVLYDSLTADSGFADSTLNRGQVKTDSLAEIPVPEKKTNDLFPFRDRQEPYSPWVVFLFLAIFSMLAWARVYYFKRIKQLFEAFASNRYISQLVREEFVFSHPSSIVLSVVFLLTGSFLLMQANHNFGWNVFTSGIPAEEATGILVYLKYFFFLALFFFGKMMIIRLSAFLFSAREEIVEYLFNMFLFNNILGLLLLPFAVSAVFAAFFPVKGVLFFSGGVVLLLFVFRLLKCVYIGSVTTKFSKWYIILYICTLEILPLFVVIRVFAAKN